MPTLQTTAESPQVPTLTTAYSPEPTLQTTAYSPEHDLLSIKPKAKSTLDKQPEAAHHHTEVKPDDDTTEQELENMEASPNREELPGAVQLSRRLLLPSTLICAHSNPQGS